MISKETIQNVLDVANLHDIIAEEVALKKQGAGYYGKCPKCDKEGKNKGLQFTPGKSIYKCFSCGFSGTSAIDFVISTKNITYPEAITLLANKYSVEIKKDKTSKNGMLQPKQSPAKITYCSTQLLESGLTEKDITASVYVDDSSRKEIPVFVAGTRDNYGRITAGNDMIIWYYDLDGKPTLYKKEKTEKFEHLFRIRWQFPDQHLDKNGNPMKYQSPGGSGQHLYFPELLRNAYQQGRPIKRLFLQEGEKKSEKACKHGMMSVGLMGINSIGRNGRLPYEINLIIQRCQVEEVVFIMDADWDDLSKNMAIEKPLDHRPWTFFNAVKNFKSYFQTLKNQNIYIELFFGYYHADKKFKGIDDQLNGPFKKEPANVVLDIDKAINEKNGIGEFYTIHKITTEVDSKIMKLWHLETADSFATHYKDVIISSGLKEFTIGKHRYRFNENYKLDLAQSITDEEKYWEDTSYTDKGGIYHEKFNFVYGRAYEFLKNRGFGRIMLKDGKWYFSQCENKIVRIVEAWEIKDYIMTISKEICHEKVMEMFYRGGKMYFGQESLSNMEFIVPFFKNADKNYQYLFFKDKYWNIMASGIEEKTYTELDSFVWNDKIIDYSPSLHPEKMVEITNITKEVIEALPEEKRNGLDDFIGEYSIDLSENANKCHYLQFLINASNFTHNKSKEEITETDLFENNRHFVAKMTCIGYLMHQYRDKSCEKAVICMDGKLSEVGASNGRSGKSLLGKAIQSMVPTVYINAKAKNLTEDPFWAEEVTEKTSVIFLDDVRANIDFEYFFPVITGQLTINGKGIRKYTLSEENTPKLLFTTNHAINGSSDSFTARQSIIAFSDFYHAKHQPKDDFGINFWTDWEGTPQYNYFYQFMAECLQLYLQIGLVTPIFDNIERRRMRQFIGEDFICWANDYFGTLDDQDANEVYSKDFVNRKLPRKDMFELFISAFPNQRKWVSPTTFKKKIRTWCDYMGLKFNPHKLDDNNQPGADDKSSGVEYFTIANDKFISSF